MFPTDDVANVPTATPVKETESPPTIPASVPGVPINVAVVEASYILLLAVIPVTVKFFAVMVCDRTLDVLPEKLLSPPYTAVMECTEPATESVLVENVATPGFAPFRFPVPSVTAPSLNVTVPVGGPPAAGVTVAVKVTEFP